MSKIAFDEKGNPCEPGNPEEVYYTVQEMEILTGRLKIISDIGTMAYARRRLLLDKEEIAKYVIDLEYPVKDNPKIIELKITTFFNQLPQEFFDELMKLLNKHTLDGK